MAQNIYSAAKLCSRNILPLPKFSYLAKDKDFPFVSLDVSLLVENSAFALLNVIHLNPPVSEGWQHLVKIII